MTDQKILEVIALYEREVPGAIDHAVNENEHEMVEPLSHVLTMLPQMRGMLGVNTEKLMRWLGFVQGVLYTTGVYSILEMKEHNRPAYENKVDPAKMGAPDPMFEGAPWRT